MSERASSTEANEALVRRYMDEAFNQGNLAAFDEFFAADFVDHNGFAGQPLGPGGVRDSYVMWKRAFPDTHVTIEDLLAAQDKVVIRTILRATQTGAFEGWPPSGKPVRIEAISIFRIAGGQIAERWGLTDVMGLRRQLGPAPMA